MSYVVADTQNMILEVWRCICVFFVREHLSIDNCIVSENRDHWEWEKSKSLPNVVPQHKAKYCHRHKGLFYGEKNSGFEEVPSKFWLNFLTGAVNLSPSWDLTVSCHQSSDAFTFQLNNPRLIGCLLLATRSAWLTLYSVLESAGKVQI